PAWQSALTIRTFDIAAPLPAAPAARARTCGAPCLDTRNRRADQSKNDDYPRILFNLLISVCYWLVLRRPRRAGTASFPAPDRLSSRRLRSGGRGAAMAEVEPDALHERLLTYVGRPMGPDSEAPDPVNVPMIRHWVDALDDRNPVYLDAEV